MIRLAALLVTLAFALPQKDAAHRHEPPAGSESQQHHAEATSLAVPLDSADHGHHVTTEQAEAIDVDRSIAEATLRWSEITGFATGVLAVFMFGLWWATRRLVLDARESSRIELRAYLGARPGKTAAPVFENVGRTPALDVALNATIFHGLQSEWPGLAGLEYRPDPGRSVVAPGHSLFMSHVVPPLDETDALRVAAGERPTIHTVARVTYRDVFGHVHETRLHLISEGENYPTTFTHAPEGNEHS